VLELELKRQQCCLKQLKKSAEGIVSGSTISLSEKARIGFIELRNSNFNEGITAIDEGLI